MLSDGTNTVMPVSPMYGNGGLFGGGDGLSAIVWLVVIIALFGGLFNGNGWFGGNGNMNGALTRGELCQDMNFQGVENSIGRLQQSVSDGFALQNTNFVDRFDALSTQMATGFDAVSLAITRDGYETRQAAQANQIALIQSTNGIQNSLKDGFCGVQNSLNQLAYQQSTDTCSLQTALASAVRDIIDNNNANTRTLYDQQVGFQMDALRQENAELRLAQSQEKQNNYLISELRPFAKPAYITCNPFAGNSCNCGCGCGA